MQKIRSLRSKGFDEYMQFQTMETYLEIRGLNKQIANINTQINLLKELHNTANMLNTNLIEKDAVKRDFVMSVYGGK